MKTLAFIFLWFFSTGAYSAPHGDELYKQYCSSCHGFDGNGGVGVPIAVPSFLDNVSDEFLKITIRTGRPGRIMPSFKLLSDAQVNAIVQYVRSWSGKAAPKEDRSTVAGDSKHGKQLFENHCVQCHGKDGVGGKGTGVTFSRKRESPIIAPALNNTGFLAAASDIMIRDTIAYGRDGTPMASMRAAGLSDDDINDLVFYIRSFELSAEKLEQDLHDTGNEPATITVDSPYGLKETVENLKQAITDQNFTLIRTDYLEHGLVPEGEENKKQVVLHFCNFKFLYDALSIDPRVGMFLPCRVTVIEKDGKVQLSTINPKRLSKLFNNHELDEYCDSMHEAYSRLLEDSVL